MTTQEQIKKRKREVTVHVNTKPVEVPKLVRGIEIKEAAIEQGVEIQLDFILTLEAHGHHEPREIDDQEEIKVDKNSSFSANDGDEDS
jgi:hypothetical protein